uniref:Centrosomal protein CEP57L1 n=1 Tax=Prolemur simus TaxID=1328070 RepID=A0A8C9B1X2_PROSS
MNSELMHSVVGSYLKPPERMFVPSFTQNESSQNHKPMDLEVTSSKLFHSPNSQEYTKRMVLNVEREKNMILEQQAQLQREKEQDQMRLHAKLEKLDVLEKECFRLTTTQKTAEVSFYLFLWSDDGGNKSLLQTGLEINRILMSSVSNPKYSKEKKKSSKKTKCLKRGPPQQIYSKFGALPFVSEKPIRKTSQCKAVPSDSEKSISICDNLSELLMAMQDELDQMSMEHQELLKQMKETESYSVCDDIECELERLVKKMEIKGEQISKLKKHQASVRKLQQKVQNSKMSEAPGIQREDIYPKGSKNIKNSPRKCLNETNPFQKNNNFHPVRVHNLQMKLRRDDIMWEQ